jgi:hypothetical protein
VKQTGLPFQNPEANACRLHKRQVQRSAILSASFLTAVRGDTVKEGLFSYTRRRLPLTAEMKDHARMKSISAPKTHLEVSSDCTQFNEKSKDAPLMNLEKLM